MKWKPIVRIVLIIIGVGLAGLLIYQKVLSSNKTDSAKKTADPAANKDEIVNAYVVKAVKLNSSVDASGTLLSNESVAIEPEINGRITHIYFKEGSYVRKGALLVKLFDEDLRAQLEKLKVQKSLVEKTLGRQEKLLKINGISQQEVDNARNQVASIEADIDYNTAQISKTELRAPFSGKLGLRYVSEGAIVSSTTVITNLDQTNPLKLDFSLPEKYSNSVHVGDPLNFTVAGVHDSITGEVYAIEPSIDQATRTVTLRAHVHNENGKLSPGSFANVHLDLQMINNALMVPTEAIIPTEDSKQVALYKNGKAKFVKVETNVRNKDKAQITHGVEAGDTVITAGLMQLKDGDAVKISNMEK